MDRMFFILITIAISMILPTFVQAESDYDKFMKAFDRNKYDSKTNAPAPTHQYNDNELAETMLRAANGQPTSQAESLPTTVPNMSQRQTGQGKSPDSHTKSDSNKHRIHNEKYMRELTPVIGIVSPRVTAKIKTDPAQIEHPKAKRFVK